MHTVTRLLNSGARLTFDEETFSDIQYEEEEAVSSNMRKKKTVSSNMRKKKTVSQYEEEEPNLITISILSTLLHNNIQMRLHLSTIFAISVANPNCPVCR